MVPLAPIGVFGILYNMSAGAVAAVYVMAAIAMLFSAISYKEMAQVFPVSGSTYSYVSLGRTASSDSCRAGRSCWTIYSCPPCCSVLVSERLDHNRALGARRQCGGVLCRYHRSERT